MVIASTVAMDRPAEAARDGGETRCGTKRLHGERLSIWVVGEPLKCALVRKIIAGSCELRRPWTCLALRHPDPILAWVKWREVAADKPSTAIEGRRPLQPCADLHVKRNDWLAQSALDGYPTRRQMLADDLIRCGVLAGRMRQDVRALLGPPDDKGKRFDEWYLGDERHLINIDAEYLRVRYQYGSAVRSRIVAY